MKILYIGPYREGTGASKTAVNIINSIHTTGIDLAIRPIKFNNYQPVLSEHMLELENKSSYGSDILIQNIPPNNMIYNSKFRNIAYVSYHTNSFKYSDWPEKLNLMDEIWVPSEFVKTACLNSDIKVPITVIPFACDEDIFLQSREIYPQIKEEKHGDFLFYTISSSFSRRKNFGALIKAFHLEFDKSEPVNVAIKFIKEYNQNDMTDRDFINQLKRGLNLGDMKEEILLPSHHLNDNDIYNIHNSCDVFVSSSYGAGSCNIGMEAMGFGRTPIVNDFGGYDYIDDSTGWRVDYSLEPVFGMDNGSLFSGRELWGAVSITALQKCMREAYENKRLREQKSEAGINKAFEYSYSNIGSLIKKALLYEQTRC